MKKLIPSFIRSSSFILLWLIILSFIAYLLQTYTGKTWWDTDYVLSLAIPFIFFPVVIWFMFVPKSLEFSESDFAIHSHLFGRHIIPWTDLKYYGKGRNVFMIQFDGRHTFQIFPKAYSDAQWFTLISFLQTRFPEKNATGSIGLWMFKIGR